MKDDAPAVSIDHVSKYYGKVCAVNDVLLEISEGEFVTLLGPSGCGKSTLLRMVAGFLDPSSGDVRLHGSSVVGVPPYRRNTSMVFQDYALFPHRTVAQNLAFGLRMRKTDKDTIGRRVSEMLETLGLAGMGVRRISAISGGQQQRVALGRALIVEPAVLLLDEPLGALDFKLRKQMQSELKGIQRRVGITFLYVTHDQEEALTMSDRVAVMNAGRIEQCASPETIYRRPSSAFVADFVGESNLLSCRVTGRDGPNRLVRIHSGDEFTVQAEEDPGTNIRLVIRPENISLLDPESPNRALRGWVSEVVFSGPIAKAVVLLGDGQPVTVSIPAGHRLPEKGANVGLGWALDAAVSVA
jgi:spermidine/putrescine transport system ATP-binding protein